MLEHWQICAHSSSQICQCSNIHTSQRLVLAAHRLSYPSKWRVASTTNPKTISGAPFIRSMSGDFLLSILDFFDCYFPSHCITPGARQPSSLSASPHGQKQLPCRALLAGENNPLAGTLGMH